VRRRCTIDSVHRPARVQTNGFACGLHFTHGDIYRRRWNPRVCLFFVELIPRAVLAPILIFVAMDIVVQSFHACPRRHAPAVALAFFPTIARLLSIKFTNPDIVPVENFQRLLEVPGKALPEMLVTIALGNGFILTAMLWGGFLAELIDRHLKRSSAYLLILAVLSFFGIVHSASPDGMMYLPWNLIGIAQKFHTSSLRPILFFQLCCFVFSFTKESLEPMAERNEMRR